MGFRSSIVISKSYHENLPTAYPETKISDMGRVKARIDAARDRRRGRS